MEWSLSRVACRDMGGFFDETGPERRALTLWQQDLSGIM